MGELFYLFNCRSLRYSMFKVGLFSNPFVLVGVVLMVLLQLGYTYLPFMNTAFHSAPISLVDWGYCVAVGVVIYIVMELEKIIHNRFLQNIAFFRD
jgi:Ca2+-transporting ATPase